MDVNPRQPSGFRHLGSGCQAMVLPPTGLGNAAAVSTAEVPATPTSKLGSCNRKGSPAAATAICLPTLVQKGLNQLPLLAVFLPPSNYGAGGSHWQNLYDILSCHGKYAGEM